MQKYPFNTCASSSGGKGGPLAGSVVRAPALFSTSCLVSSPFPVEQFDRIRSGSANGLIFGEGDPDCSGLQAARAGDTHRL